MNKRKIINDPVYGFITIPNSLCFDIIEHPWFQRLRRIKQLGLTELVYPGAIHTRFNHAIGAMHLMVQAIDVLKSKGHEISDQEREAAIIAILLHDIGHGPYSHTLEYAMFNREITHEMISEQIIWQLNKEFDGKLEMAMAVFTDKYPKHFLHQLVSSQLDVDRMDYLNRDSYFTGVHEGVIGYDRIIKMLDIKDDELVVELKGIYSIEKFLIARRLMYWQVYLHKAVLCAEQMLVKVIERARYLTRNGKELGGSEALIYFLSNDVSLTDDNLENLNLLKRFVLLDDYDILSAIKLWTNNKDRVLAYLCKCIVNRKLFRVELSDQVPDPERKSKLLSKICRELKINSEDAEFLVFQDSTSNSAYNPYTGSINIIYRDGKVEDIAKASDQLNISVLSQPVTKHFLCYPKWLNQAE